MAKSGQAGYQSNNELWSSWLHIFQIWTVLFVNQLNNGLDEHQTRYKSSLDLWSPPLDDSTESVDIRMYVYVRTYASIEPYQT